MSKLNKINYRLSGHDSFVCRYAWLPKAVKSILANPFIFQDDEKDIIEMGVGKNMVKSIKFWIDVMGIVHHDRHAGYSLTAFGKALFQDEYDPYLEDIKTLWLLHWQLSSHVESPVFAWDYMLNKWHNPDIVQSKVIAVFIDETVRLSHKVSPNTLKNHFNIFLHTYIPTRGAKGEVLEDNLDSPLIELDLIRKIGERKLEDSNKNETIYAFNKEDKPEISPELFLYTLLDYREKKLENSKKIGFNEIANGHGSPGQIFKLPESCIRERLERISKLSNGDVEFKEASNSQHIFINDDNVKSINYLEQVYKN
jgi:uncharacterized protein DUF4007